MVMMDMGPRQTLEIPLGLSMMAGPFLPLVFWKKTQGELVHMYMVGPTETGTHYH